MVALSLRNSRRHQADKPKSDQRSPAQQDRDRILHSSAFRRLGGITQVVSAAEGHIFHNRLTHTLKVAQIGRRLGEWLISSEGIEAANAVGGIDPEIVEAAALAHDLGHPPFGHIAEDEINDFLKGTGLDGFEGNAQSFRIVTKIACRFSGIPGLDLTRATLNAILKYPWLRKITGKGNRKWGAYLSEQADFNFARQSPPPSGEQKSVEAELMDWADDIAYSVHDVEDFYRAGLIPLDQILWNNQEVDTFFNEVFDRRNKISAESKARKEALKASFLRVRKVIADFFPPLRQPYSGSLNQRVALRTLTSQWIGRYIKGIKLSTSSKKKALVEIDQKLQMEISMLKELTWHYVITNPALSTQQFGQRRVIRELLNIFMNELNLNRYTIFPIAYREQLKESIDSNDQTRIVSDLVSGMTEQQAVLLHQKLTGVNFGSVLDFIGV